MAAKYPHVEAATRYARAVLDGSIPAYRYTRLACQRYLDDLAQESDPDYPYYFDKTEAERVCEFVELLPHTKGEWAFKRQLIKLEPWQVFGFVNIFGWKSKADDLRRFREVYWCVPRKNGKSIIAAGVGLYMFACDNEFGAEVYSGATNERQAWEVFRPAKLMVSRTPLLQKAKGIAVNAKNLNRPADEARFEPVIGKPGDGASPSCALIDEYHEHDAPDLYETMVTGQGARRQPLTFIITTAGNNIEGPCYDKQTEAQEMLDGVAPNDELFALMYGVDDPERWADPDVLAMANPNLGVSVYKKYLESQQQKAIRSARFQNIFKIKHLNIWVTARSAFFNMEQWQRCYDPSLSVEDFEGQECIGGLDLAGKLDLNAFVKLFYRDLADDDRRVRRHYYCLSPVFWAPEDTVNNPDNRKLSSRYQKWVNLGALTATDGAEVDYLEVLAEVTDTNQRHPIAEIGIDPHGALNLSHRLDDENLNPVQITQNYSGMSAGMKELEAAIAAGRFHHDGHPILTWCMGNVVGRYMGGADDDIVRPTKEHKDKKIDGAVALIMAVGRAMLAAETTGPSIRFA
ncbi:terminase large subunit [Hahella sp. NBU794]|uniref:terminase large subunit n=1 Tax=Hahella sp. NBU794 TaxID=3422590 RepID=UPI003D6F39C2